MKKRLITKNRIFFALTVAVIITLLTVFALVFSTSAESTLTVGEDSDGYPVITWRWGDGATDFTELTRNNEVYAIDSTADFYALQLYYERVAPPEVLDISIIHNSNIVITGTLNGETFRGIGSAEHPFNGIVTHSSGLAYSITLPDGVTLFNHLSTSATFEHGIYIQNGGFAKVLVADTATANYSGKTINIGGTVSYAESAGAFAGRVKAGTSSTLALTLPTIGFPTSVTSTANDAGSVIGRIDSGVDVTLSGIPASVATSITAPTGISDNGGAGGLVGCVLGSLTIDGTTPVSFAHTGTVTGRYSGALVGRIYGNGELTQTGTLTVSGNDVIGTYSAGGLIGRFSGESLSLATMSLSGGCSVSGASYCGGLVGYSKAFDIGTGVTIGTDSSRVTVNGTSSTGGIIGFIDDATTGVCNVQPANVYVALEAGANTGVSGGLIGTISAKRVTCSGITINQTNTRTNNNSNGTLVGTVSNNAIFDCGSVTLSGSATTKRAIGTTGVKSVVRFTGTLSYTGSINTQYIVGVQNNSLIYCEYGWSLTRNNATPRDDIGNYGQIYINDANGTNGIGSVITYSNTENTVTVEALPSLSVSDVSAFAKLSIYLSSQGNFGSVTGYDNYTDVLAANITLGGNISLTGTGIESLTRTDINTNSYSGTMSGAYTVTLNIGSTYPYAAGNLTGYYSRPYVGLFASVNNAIFTNIKIAGNIFGNADSANVTHAGGIAGYASGTATVTGVALSETITEKGGTEGTASYYGGMFGEYSGTTLTATGCTNSVEIALIAGTYAHTGGYIGKATISGSASFSGSVFSGSIENTTDTFQNAVVGGFIATLVGTANTTTVNLNTITAGGEVNVKASGKSGGLIGYEWTDVNVTLGGTASGTLSATGGNFGGLFHTVSGKLTLQSGFTVTGSYSETSGGLIVNNGEQLYMVVKCADTFSSGVTTATGIVDRLVATNITARGTGNVANRGGIVTIEIAGAGIGEMPVSTSGWYSLPANGNTRYYYNIERLDIANGGATGDGEAARLLLWHICDYANTTPGTYFGTATPGFTAEGDMNMSGMCFYPSTATGTYSLGGNTLTFGLPAGVSISNTTQYYGVQTGLLLDVGYGNTTITNGTITGVVNRLSGSDGSGAAIVGTVTGNLNGSTVRTANLTLSSLTLNGLSVSGNVTSAYYAPLLVNKINQYATITVDNITNRATTNTATSLIGNAGSNTALELNITFSQMKMNGESGASAFSRATFINSLAYASGSCVYNFDFSEDWDAGAPPQHIKLVTYGRELSDVTQYYDQSIPVHPTTLPTTSTTPFDFGTATYLYYIASGSISVNVKGGDLLDGYGKYSSPYTITSFNQLYAIARFINDGTCDATWKINYPIGWTDYITSATPDEITVAGSGYETLVRTYLQGAYYYVTISNNNVIDSVSFIGTNGIGTNDKPFHGVIYGSDTSLLNLAAVSDKAKWGFVNVADGCVIKGIKINYTETATATERQSTSTGDLYFGGVIGCVVGGDNIIESVDVTLQFGALSENHKQVYIGGYVGLVKSGGVVFRSVNPTITYDTVDATAIFGADSEHYYANPIIGRVLDAYAVCESGTVPNNNNKNYKIWDASSVSAATTVSGQTVTIADGYGMMLFTSAYNSRALTSASYIARKGTYTGIGTPVTTIGNTSTEYDSSDATRFLLSKMTVTGARPTTATKFSITLSADCDVYDYGNAFRGFGGMYEKILNGNALSSSENLIFISVLDGNVHRVTMNRTVKQYGNGELYYADSVGLINYLPIETAVTIQDILLSGTVSFITNGFSNTQTGVYNHFTSGYAGGLIGATEEETTYDFKVQNVNTSGLTVRGDNYSGGLIGYCRCKATIQDCVYNTLSISSRNTMGGLIGTHSTVASTSITIKYTAEKQCSGLTLGLSSTALANSFRNEGFGGLIGWSGRNITINSGENDCVLTISNINISITNVKDTYTSAGGVVGHISGFGTNIISKVTVVGGTVSCGSVIDNTGTAGGIVGGVHRGESWSDCNITIQNCSVTTTDENVGTSITGYSYAGGIIGLYKIKCDLKTPEFTMTDCSVSGATVLSKSFAGGALGASITQDNSTNLINTITNVTISGATIGSANTATSGGFFGSVQGNITVTTGNVTSINGENEEIVTRTTVTATGNAGGIAGIVNAQILTINSFTTSGVNLEAKKVGAFAAITPVSGNTLTVYFNNLTASNCTYTGGTGNDGYAGVIAGSVSNNSTVYGNSILWQNNTVTGRNKGVCFGSVGTTDTTVRLLGVSRIGGDNALTADCGSGSADVVYASYGVTSTADILTTPTYNTDWIGDSFGTITNGDTTTRTATLLNGLAWWRAKDATLNSKIIYYNDPLIKGTDTTPYLDVPMFLVEGTEATIASYLDILTNGGFSAWDGTISISAQRYTVTDTVLTEDSGDFGSVSWNGTAFVKTSSYDDIGKLTLITVTFTNTSGSGATTDYIMDVALFFPPVLAYWTNIIQIDREEYCIDEFLDIDKTDRSIVVTPNQAFTFYIEYIYNEVGARTSSYLTKSFDNFTANNIPVGTKLMLIDLNPNNYGKAYYKTIGAGEATRSVPFSSFDANVGTTRLDLLPTLSELTVQHQPIIGFVGDEGSDSDITEIGIERYMVVMVLPSDSVQDNGEALYFDFYANADSESVTFENNDADNISDRYAQVQAWAETTVTLATSVRNPQISKSVPIEIDVTATIRYPSGYISTANSLHSERYAFISMYITNSDSQMIQFPAGTRITYPDLTENLIASAATTRNYTVTVDLSAVSDADYQSFVHSVESFRINILYYLVSSSDSTQGEVEGTGDCTADLSINEDVPLTVTVSSENTLSLGINKYEDTTGEIEFTLKADLSNLQYTAGDTLALRLGLFEKDNYGRYDTASAHFNRFTLTSSTPGVTVVINDTDDIWTVDLIANPGVTGYVTDIDITFSLSIDLVPGDIPPVNHKLNIELVRTNNSTDEILNSDYFIFTVSNIYTQID